MPAKTSAISLEKFITFGDLLKYLRRRAGLTQRELSIAVGYSDAQISRLEQNQRPPDISTIAARFVPALGIEGQPDLAARLMELGAAVRREDAPAAGLVPFKGLLFFDEADAELFCGREALTARLLTRLIESCAALGAPRFLALVGASGSGKSSVVRAGLVPALHWNPRTSAWPVHVLTPTAHPLEALAASLGGEDRSATARARLVTELALDPGSLKRALQRETQLANVAHALLVVDQFEELFTLCRGDIERRAFLDNVLNAASEPDGPALAVIALRADFYGHCADYPNLREALAHHQEYIGGMTPEELRRAIEEPARAGHWEFEPGLVDQMLADVEGEPGALPLLSHALLETWQRRRGHTLTLSGYAAAGGVRGAIAETAEAVFQDQLTPDQRAIARHIFLRLTEMGEDETLPDTRRRVALGELSQNPEGTQAVREVLTLLADARLITTEKETAEVAHEALIREWPTLRGWLMEDREGLRLHRRLTDALLEWEQAKRAEGELYRGARLAQALEWAEANLGELNGPEREFLAASQELAEREAAQREAQRQRELEAAHRLAETERARADSEQAHGESERQRAEEQVRHLARVRIRNRVIAVAGVVALVLAVLAGLFGLQSNRNAVLAGANLAGAQLANTQAADNAATAQAASLLAAQQRDVAVGAQGTAQAASLLAAQQRDVAIGAQSTAQAERDRADAAAAQAFSRELAVQSQLNITLDPERSILLALAAFDRAHTLEGANALHAAVTDSRLRLVLRGHAGDVLKVAYSPDGKLMATASADMTARLWDAGTGVQLALFQHMAGVSSVQFSPDGARLVTADVQGWVRFWDVASGQATLKFQVVPPALLPDPTYQQNLVVKLSPDGRLLATTVWTDHRVRIWDSRSGTELFSLSDPAWLRVAPGVDLGVANVEFSPDGTRLALSLLPEQGGIELWDIATRKRVLALPGHWYVDAKSLSFSPDGTRLLTTGPDGRDTVFDLTTVKLMYELKESENQIKFSADGKRLLAAGTGGRVKVFDAATGDELLVLVGHAGRVFSVSEQPGCVRPPAAPFEWCGMQLASSSDDDTVRVWDVSPAGSQELLTVPGHDMALNEAGTRLTTFDLNAIDPTHSSLLLQAWDLPAWTGQAAPLVQATNFQSSTIEIGAGALNTHSFPRAGILGVNYGDGHYRFWDVADGGRDLYDFVSCEFESNEFSFSSRQRPLVAIGCVPTGTVEIWDPVVPQQISTFQVAKPFDLWQMVFSPNGGRLATINSDHTVHIWDSANGQKLFDLPTLATLGALSINFSPDSRWVTVSDCAGNVAIFDATTGDKRQTLQGSVACITGVDFSPDRTQIAVSSLLRDLHVFDLNSGREIAILSGGGFVQFTPDGKRLIALRYDQGGLQEWTVRLYTLQLDELVALARTRVTRSLTLEECRTYLHTETCPAGP